MKKIFLHTAASQLQLMVVIGLLCLFISNAYATTYYVATNGNDNNAGTKELPFLTIGKGASVAVAGDIVIIKSGTYKPTNRIQPANSGTQTAPITFMAEVKDEAIIDGSGAASPTSADRLGLFTVLGTATSTQNWIVVDGLRIINSTWAGFYARFASNITFKNCSTLNTGASGFIGANSNDIKVLNCKVQKACVFPLKTENTNECITMASVVRFEVAYNTVSDRQEDVSNGGEGIDAKNDSKDGSIHHNTVFNLTRTGLYIDAYQRNLSNIDVYANTVYKGGVGITVAIEEGGTLTGVKIHDNIVYDVLRAGIQVRGYLRTGVMKDVFVYQNTVVRTGNVQGITYENAGILIDADHPNNSNIMVRNNIVSECAIQIKTKSYPFYIVDNNLLFGTSSTPKPSDPTVLYGNAGTNAILADPLFEDAAKNNFNLKTDSPAIDKATGNPLSEIDFYDFKRTGKGDLGAIENQKTPVVVILGNENLEDENKSFILFPNPSNGAINIKWYAEANTPFKIDIINLQGNIVKSVDYFPNKNGENIANLPTESLANGTYIVSISDKEGNRLSKKMIVQK